VGNDNPPAGDEDGSGQRCVTTLLRGSKSTPSRPWMRLCPNSESFQPPMEYQAGGGPGHGVPAEPSGVLYSTAMSRPCSIILS
jgi:hypothetical protein